MRRGEFDPEERAELDAAARHYEEAYVLRHVEGLIGRQPGKPLAADAPAVSAPAADAES